MASKQRYSQGVSLTPAGKLNGKPDCLPDSRPLMQLVLIMLERLEMIDTARLLETLDTTLDHRDMYPHGLRYCATLAPSGSVGGFY